MDATVFSEMSDEDIAIVIQILQTDGQEAISVATGKGKNPEGVETDTQVAFKLFLEEVKNAEAFSTDRRMTRSIQQAVYVDGDALVQSQHENRVAQADRNMALALSTGDSGAAAPEGTLADTPDDYGLIAKLSYLYVTGIDDADSDTDLPEDGDIAVSSQPESSTWAALRPPARTTQRRQCEACRDRKHFAELAKASCGHEYCRECLTHLFRDAMTDESLFPPRCCRQPMALDKMRLFLDQDVVQQFRKKALEFSTPNRTYCHNSNCSAFIPSTNYADSIATCEECGDRTCMTCKGVSHNGDCPNDEQLQQVIRLAREQGWQRCQNCWGMVELNTGCYHMTCRCGFQFCYVCGAKWKTCQCEQWDERRLFERAAQIDARDHAAQEEAPRIVNQHNAHNTERHREQAARQPQQLHEQQTRERNRQERLQTLMRDLANDHECDHERWFGRPGPMECEECHDVMPLYIYQCRQCHIMACRRCRYHRL